MPAYSVGGATIAPPPSAADVAGTFRAIIADATADGGTGTTPCNDAGASGMFLDVDMLVGDGGGGGGGECDETLSAEEHVEMMIFLETTLREELRREQAEALAQYEAMLEATRATDAEALDTAAAQHEAMLAAARQQPAATVPACHFGQAPKAAKAAAAREEEEPTLCPVCKKDWLLVADGGRVFFCRCGLRLDVQNDGLSLGVLRQQLAALYEAHSTRGCSAEPVFEPRTQWGITALWGGCNKCGLCELLM